MYSQDVQWMDIMYDEHTGINYKIPINQDYLSDEEELDEQDDPVQLKTDDTKLNEQEKRKHLRMKQKCPVEKPKTWSGWQIHIQVQKMLWGVPEVKT